MKSSTFAAIVGLALLPGTAFAKLNVVATIPDFGSIAAAIGGDQIKLATICRGTEDAHFVDARPSFIRMLNQADVLIEGGAELEIGWLPPLVNGARNGRILGSAPGHVIISRGIQMLEIPTEPIDRSMGDVHPAGNPHFWTDPANGKIMAATLAKAFSKLEPASAAYFAQNLKQFNERLDQKIAAWAKALEPYRGTKVISYHKSYNYFLARFGFELAGTLEPKPGVEPSPGYLNGLIGRLKHAGVKLILIEPFRGRKIPGYVAVAIGAKVIVLPDKVGAHEQASDYFNLFDHNVAQIVAALKESS